MAFVRWGVWASAAAVCVVAHGAAAAPPPASAFGRVPAVVDAEISPNGQRVAILGGTSEQRIISIATIDQAGLPILQLGDVETTDLLWAGNEHVIATVAFWEWVDVNRAFRVERHIAVNTRAEAVSRFLEQKVRSSFLVSQPILQVTRESPPRVAVVDLVKPQDRVVMSAIWSVDPTTGRSRLAERGSISTWGWDVDSSGQARVRLDHDRAGIYVRAKGESAWRPLVSTGTEVPAYYGYSEPKDAVYLRRGGKLELRRLSNGSSETIHEGDDEVALIWDRHRNEAVALETGLERPQLRWLDVELGVVHRTLSQALKGGHVSLMGWSEDRTRFVARTSSPSSPPAWYLFDRTRKEISPLGGEYPELAGVAMGTTRWITYKARDGLEIPAYVTLPPGAPAKGGKLPLVVLPHGGPRARDVYEFDFIAQFIATRGYAVLQPQFRGSSGFGDKFASAGKGEWGGKMQTDLQDGVAALAAAGDVDPKRVCIVGASFGGYAALAGATLFPDAYRCAASIAGVSDLGQLILEEGRLYGRDSGAAQALREELAAADRAKLLAMSPARQAATARIPILLIHGDKDTVVLLSQSKRMAEALKAAGKEVEFIVLENENHYLTKTATRTQTLETLERFLAKNLPVN